MFLFKPKNGRDNQLLIGIGLGLGLGIGFGVFNDQLFLSIIGGVLSGVVIGIVLNRI